jgi:hypothetical protein
VAKLASGNLEEEPEEKIDDAVLQIPGCLLNRAAEKKVDAEPSNLIGEEGPKSHRSSENR